MMRKASMSRERRVTFPQDVDPVGVWNWETLDIIGGALEKMACKLNLCVVNQV